MSSLSAGQPLRWVARELFLPDTPSLHAGYSSMLLASAFQLACLPPWGQQYALLALPQLPFFNSLWPQTCFNE